MSKIIQVEVAAHALRQTTGSNQVVTIARSKMEANIERSIGLSVHSLHAQQQLTR